IEDEVSKLMNLSLLKDLDQKKLALQYLVSIYSITEQIKDRFIVFLKDVLEKETIEVKQAVYSIVRQLCNDSYVQ
ncbi:MAG: hypothetical protein MHPSP_001991, partial [Paramarteilia canceri]